MKPSPGSHMMPPMNSASGRKSTVPAMRIVSERRRRAIICARASVISERSTGYMSASWAAGTGRRVDSCGSVGADLATGSAARAVGTKTWVSDGCERRPSARMAWPNPSTERSRFRSSLRRTTMGTTTISHSTTSTKTVIIGDSTSPLQSHQPRSLQS